MVDIAVPHIAPAGAKLPVIYVTDADAGFALVAQTMRLMQMGPFPLPPAIVVGIGYPSDTPEEAALASKLRFRDLSPWVDETHDVRFRNAPPPWTLPDWIQQGGAGNFLAFVEQELKPLLASRYEVDEGDQTLVGMSLGGLFVMHALLTAPASFKRYVALSPSLYWAEKRIFEAEAALAAGRKDLPIHLFLGVGGLEEAHDIDCAMVSNAYAMEARLRTRGYEGLKLSFQVFPDETHMSVFAASVTRGLCAVFGGHGDIDNWAKVLSQ